MSKIAHIVAIETGSLGDLGFGISDRAYDVLHVFDESVAWIGPRQHLETDFDFVQPIPYIVIKHGDLFLAYARGAGGGDTRLHGKISIGFGGHVDLADAATDQNGVIDLRKTMENACVRELEEELGIVLTGMMPEQRASLCNWTHVISSDASEVDRVHIGLVNTIDVSLLPGIDPDKFEDVIENAQWRTADELMTEVPGVFTLETWTALVLSSFATRSN